MANPARAPRFDADAFGEADLDAERLGARESQTVYPPAWQPGQSDIQALTVPPDAVLGEALPSSIEEAVLAMLDQVPRIASVPPPRAESVPDEPEPSGDAP